MPQRPIVPGPAPPNRLGSLLRHRRGQLGLSLRETARRAGISAGYLVSLEQGRNPSTGRPPIPSPPVLAAIGRVLGIALPALLDVTGTPVPPSSHVLLYQTGPGPLSGLDGARRVAGAGVDAWVVVTGAGAAAYDRTRALAALADQLAALPRRPAPRRLGLVFAGASAHLRAAEHAAAPIQGEATWERDVAAACRAVVAVEPAANVCVYRDADVRGLEGRADPLAAVVELLRTHPHVAVQDAGGGVETGPAAIETILEAVRPASIAAGAWAALAAAAAAGFTRAAAMPA